MQHLPQSSRSTRFGDGPMRNVALSLGGLIIVILITGLAGLAVNGNVTTLTKDALRYDIELEDEGDDLRAAVLDVRHFHRNLLFNGINEPNAIPALSEAIVELEEEIADYAELPVTPDVATAAELTALLEQYRAIFEPAIALYDDDPAAFQSASNRGLAVLADLDSAVRAISDTGDRMAERSLATVDQSNGAARGILIGVLAGVALIGGGLGWSAFRVVRQMRDLYEAQKRTAEKLEAAVTAKTNFVADASHELRTPLTVLRGNAEAGLMTTDPRMHREIFEEIVGESARMTGLVEDLLLLARSDADALPLDLETVEAELFLVELVDRATVLMSQRGRELRANIQGVGAMIADHARLSQALMALVDNAGKYGAPDTVVTISSRTVANQLGIEIIDRGPGLQPHEIDSIFERFYRADTARSRRLGGAGLGLSIARTIIEAHGGTLQIESQPGIGTTARVTIGLVGAAVPRRHILVRQVPVPT